MAAEYVLVCDEASYDASTGTCSAAYYEPAPAALPALSYDEAQAIGGKLVLVIVVAWCFRKARKVAV